MRAKVMVGALLAASLTLPQAWAQSGGRYEPSQRLPLLEGCLKDETKNGAYCVKKCQPDFRMDMSGKTVVCVAAKSDAKYTPPKPEYETPKTPLQPGAKGS